MGRVSGDADSLFRATHLFVLLHVIRVALQVVRRLVVAEVRFETCRMIPQQLKVSRDLFENQLLVVLLDSLRGRWARPDPFAWADERANIPADKFAIGQETAVAL